MDRLQVFFCGLNGARSFYAQKQGGNSMREVILYGAGEVGTAVASMKVRPASLSNSIVVCICDQDKAKQGLQIKDLTVISPEEAFEQYQDADIFVCALAPLLYSIFDSLQNKFKIKQGRIVNYEPYDKFLSCDSLQNNIYLMDNGVVSFCCWTTLKRTDYPLSPYAGGGQGNT